MLLNLDRVAPMRDRQVPCDQVSCCWTVYRCLLMSGEFLLKHRYLAALSDGQFSRGCLNVYGVLVEDPESGRTSRCGADPLME